MTLIISFLTFLLVILSIGLYSKKFSKKTSEDYLLASGELPVWQVTLSALASTSSGFMYIGLIGYVYTKGLSGIWLIITFLFGEYIMVYYAPKKISVATKNRDLRSYNDLVANYWGSDQIIVKKLAAIITLFFLSLYAAAQYSAAGKALHSMLGWYSEAGVLITYVVVLSYCFAGGIRASIWTDIVQFLLMVSSIAILVVMTLSAIGGWGVLVEKLYQYPPAYMQPFPDSMGGVFFIILFALGWIFGGLGVLGQPHIAVRYMTLRKTRSYRNMLYLYYTFSFAFSMLCLFSAFLAKVYFSDANIAVFDTEEALPQLAIAILPSILVGLMLSGIFAAIVSTADSQILSSAAALGNDLLPKQEGIQAKLRQNKFATVLVATLALLAAVWGGQSVFSLVVIAWSGLASAFTPILIMSFLGYQTPQSINIAMMLGGLTAAIIWRVLGLNAIAYDALIGIITGFIIFFIAKQFISISRAKPQLKQKGEFELSGQSNPLE